MKLGKKNENKTINESWSLELYKMKGREWKEFYMEWANYVWEEIGDFTESINIKLLLKDWRWINDMLSSVDKISNYIENNVEGILNLDITKLNSFRNNISVLRKKMEKLYYSDKLDVITNTNIHDNYKNLNMNYKKLLNKK